MRLKPEDVWIWYAHVPTSLTQHIDVLSSTLSPVDRVRAKGFRFHKDRLLFVCARALLRQCLFDATNFDNFILRPNFRGKPELYPPFGDPTIQFNLSHTHGMITCAVGRSGTIGIDAEYVDHDFPFLNVAKLCFTENEYHQIHTAAQSLQINLFFQIWTLKEAVAKATGHGLFRSLKSFTVSVTPPNVTILNGNDKAVGFWRLECLAPTPIHQIAVAINCMQKEELLLSWRKVDLLEVVRANHLRDSKYRFLT